ncbi:MAG: carbamoyltransferase HypF [Ignavibacteriae bacterium]|nr:carbamoyltransferase HypF [Ignavibacteriota bacterium]
MLQRVHIAIQGAVQGVGFRPFVYRLATELRLAGWVANTPTGLVIEAEGERSALDMFLLRLAPERPRHSHIQSIESSFLDPAFSHDFVIRESRMEGERSAFVLPDLAMCPDCLAEMLNPTDRRYLYPFTNCTHCGPRYSIIDSLPYDRARTSMKLFEMCDDCRAEYELPTDRRFHAQPNACPKCGPHLECWNREGKVIASRHDAIELVARMIGEGKIAAVKGLGGFHLMVDVRNEAAVRELRRRKHREEKPLAVMFPDMTSVRSVCDVSELEEQLLRSSASPIVLLERSCSAGHMIADSVAPGNPYLGVLLPYTGIHYVLMREMQFPVVATSGNLTDEPICIDEEEALQRLQGIVDIFLVHNRPILRHVDDSVVRVMLGREQLVRRARGYAPLPVDYIAPPTSRCILAVGAHQKNAIAIANGANVFVSQHIGDLETGKAYDAFLNVAENVSKLFDATPTIVVADEHPDYLSTQFAKRTGLELQQVQHHYAHVLSCMAENQIDDSVLGVSWDGTGYGLDGTIWGGEFLIPKNSTFERLTTFRPFKLPGSSKSVKEPRRVALGVLFEIFGDDVFERGDLHPVSAFEKSELALIRQMLERNINCPATTSVGRLFDAVASILNLRQKVSFEGQAAMMLEFAIARTATNDAYEFHILDNTQRNGSGQSSAQYIVDWAPAFHQLLDEAAHDVSPAVIAAKFHNTLVEIIVEIARRAALEKIVLTGGCFQNKYLTERTVGRLTASGFRPYWHQRVPPNDGGISLGQIHAVLRTHKSTLQVHQHREEIRV